MHRDRSSGGISTLEKQRSSIQFASQCAKAPKYIMQIIKEDLLNLLIMFDRLNIDLGKFLHVYNSNYSPILR